MLPRFELSWLVLVVGLAVVAPVPALPSLPSLLPVFSLLPVDSVSSLQARTTPNIATNHRDRALTATILAGSEVRRP